MRLMGRKNITITTKFTENYIPVTRTIKGMRGRDAGNGMEEAA